MSALGIKTHFSVSTSILKPKEVIAQAKDLGYTRLALCDNMTMSGMTEWVSACKKHDIDYIVGVSMNFFKDALDREKSKKRPRAFCALKAFAKNEDGLKQLFQLISSAYSEQQFYYSPRLDANCIKGKDLSNLVFTTGDINNVFAGDRELGENLLNCVKASGAELFVELMAVDQPYYLASNKHALEYAHKHELETVVSRPALYPNDSADVRDIAQAVTTNSSTNSIFAPKPFKRDFHLMSESEVHNIAKSLSIDDLDNSDALFSACSYQWDKQPMSLPKLAEDEFGELVSLCKQGWKERASNKVFGERLDSSRLSEYKDRLKYELSIIKDMGFSAYFLLVQYVVNHAKDNDILVGPARGSAAGSLVAYLLKITDVDPLRFGLIFERFLNPDRLDYPDIDLDFMSSRRGEIIEHLINEFGEDNVSGIANYNTLGSASSLRDVARISNLPLEEYECSKLVPKEHGNAMSLEESAELVTAIENYSLKYPRQWRQSLSLQGTIRAMGQHAAGIVVAGEPIMNRGVVTRNKDYPIVTWDKRVVEDWGLIKLDVLGLSTLDIIDLALKKIHASGTSLDLWQIPLDDEKTLDVFAQGRTKGVFQFEGGMARTLCREIAVSGDFSFNDIVAVNALNRPGPLEAGLTDKYVKIRQKHFSPEYPHPKTEEALEETHSVIVYQEQVMQLARDLCGFTMSEADTLRKAIGKKDPTLMKTMEDKFISGAEDNGMLSIDASALWMAVEGFAAYSFNKSHAVAYSLISYQAAYLKAHFAGAFYAASMTILDDDKVKLIAKEASNDGFVVMPPDINHSTDSFEIVYDTKRAKNVLYSPLTAVKNVSSKVCAHIIEVRSALPTGFTSYKHFFDSVKAAKCNKRAKENLDKVGAFALIEPTQKPSLDHERLRDQKELMGALAVADVKPDRHIDISPVTKDKMADLYDEMASNGKLPILPNHGKKPKFVVITDKPTYFEIQEEKSFKGKSNHYLKTALSNAKLKPSEGYYTHLVKAAPDDKNKLSKEEIAYYGDFLKQELDLLDPPLVVLAGTQSIRYFFPDAKGSAEDLCRTVEYVKDNDRSYMLCINPQMIYIKPEKQELLNQVFTDVYDLFYEA